MDIKLNPTDIALVVREDGQLEMWGELDSERLAPLAQLLLVAFYVRLLQDEEFALELEEWFDNENRKIEAAEKGTVH